MEIQNRRALLKTGTLTDQARRERATSAGILSLSALWRRRWLIATVTALTTLGALVLSFQLPVWYQAEARVLMPESGGAGGGTITSMVNKIAPGAASLLGGGGGGDFTRYQAILNSRSTLEKAIERYDLQRVYELDDHPYPRTATINALVENVSFEVDLEFDYLAVRVLDLDPKRAAAIANFFVDELNERSASLSVDQAKGYREFVEERYGQSVADVDSAQMAMQRFQERHGVVELPEMAKAFLETAASQRAEAIRAEVQYRAALVQYGPDNPQVRQLAELVRAGRTSQEALVSGGDRLMPVALDDLPAVANEYATLYRDVMMYGSILEFTRPLLEQARFDEERVRTAVQVLDEAVVPERKAKPKKAFVVAGAFFTALLLSCTVVLVLAWMRRKQETLRSTLRRITAPGLDG